MSLYREIFDPHSFDHPNCLIAAIAVPNEHSAAWARAIAWRPKIEGWTQSFQTAIECVLGGVRPLLYGWPASAMFEAAATQLVEAWVVNGCPGRTLSDGLVAYAYA